jgi:hypothetical protein
MMKLHHEQSIGAYTPVIQEAKNRVGDTMYVLLQLNVILCSSQIAAVTLQESKTSVSSLPALSYATRTLALASRENKARFQDRFDLKESHNAQTAWYFISGIDRRM